MKIMKPSTFVEACETASNVGYNKAYKGVITSALVIGTGVAVVGTGVKLVADRVSDHVASHRAIKEAKADVKSA